MSNKKIILPLVALFSATALASCGNGPEDKADPEILAVYKAYKANANEKGETALSYEEWLASIKGEKGDTGDQGQKGDDGAQGPKGDKGDTGEQGPKGDKGDTGEQGPKGDKGDTGATGKSAFEIWQEVRAEEDGDDPEDHTLDEFIAAMTGVQGENGKSAYEAYREAHPDYEGSEAQWIKDLCEGTLSTKYYTVSYYENYVDGAGRFNADLKGLDKESISYTRQVKKGEYAPRPADPTREGFTFDGWYVSYKDEANTYHYEPYFFRLGGVEDDLSLYAKWTANEYKVTIHAGHDSYEVAAKYNASLEVPAAVANNNEGKLFEGLYRDEDFEVRFDTNSTYKDARDLDLFAKYIGFEGIENGKYFAEDSNNWLVLEINGNTITANSSHSTRGHGEYALTEIVDGYYRFSKEGEDLFVKVAEGKLSVVGTYFWKESDPTYEWFKNGNSGNFLGRNESAKADKFVEFGAYVANTSLTLANAEIDLIEGKSVSVEPIFDANASMKSYTVEISDEDKEYISYSSFLKAISVQTGVDAGGKQAHVIFKDNDGNSVTLTINMIAKTYIPSLAIGGEGIVDGEVTIELGTTLQLTAVYPLEGYNVNPSLKWTVPYGACVGVKDGLVTPKQAGSAVVTLTDESGSGLSATVKVNVVKPVINIPASIVGTYDIPVTVGDEDYNPTTGIAKLTIDADGKIKFEYESCGESFTYNGEIKSGANNVYTYDLSFFWAEYYETCTSSFKVVLKDDGSAIFSVISDDMADYYYIIYEDSYKIVDATPVAHSVTKVSGLDGGMVVLGSADEQYKAGETVSFQVKPDEDYEIVSVSIVYHPEITVTVTSSTNPFSGATTYRGSFTMPDFDVQVTAEFKSTAAPAAGFDFEAADGASFELDGNFESMMGSVYGSIVISDGSVYYLPDEMGMEDAVELSYDFEGCEANEIHVYGEDDLYSYAAFDTILAFSNGSLTYVSGGSN